jgi:hypothetical protein
MRILLLLNLILSIGLAQDFMVTATAAGPDNSTFETGVVPSVSSYSPFVRKFDSTGRIVFSRTFDIRSASASAIAVTPKGEPIIAGRVILEDGQPFPTTPGAYVANESRNTGFLMKLDPTGQNILLASRGFGAGILALDRDDNIYIAGAALGPNAFTPSPGAFQSTYVLQACGGSGFVGIPCPYQYVAKLNPEGTRLIYATYLTGSYGATPSALAIDADGNALIAGTTNSPDYPTTPDTFQPGYRAEKRRPAVGFRPPVIPPASCGFVTKLNSDGTALIWSTYFSGTGADSLTGLKPGDNDTLILAGFSTSADLPGAQPISPACVFSYSPQVPFLAQISGDAKQILLTRYLYDTSTSLPSTLQPATATPYLCATDSADSSFLTAGSPNQLVSLHATGLDEGPVSINGQPAAILYRSSTQLNLRLPATATAFDIQIGHLNRKLEFSEAKPAAFLDLSSNQPLPGTIICQGRQFGGVPPVARNEDGTLNSCANPAPSDSIITLYLNGLTEQPNQVITGAGSEVIAIEPDPDSPQGVWRLKLRILPGYGTGFITPILDGKPLRLPNLAIFVR